VKYTPRYSGPGKSGICKCGHSWEDHHCGIVLNEEYYRATGEVFVPQECEFYGCNELGGCMPNPDNSEGAWVLHCETYEDRGMNANQAGK